MTLLTHPRLVTSSEMELGPGGLVLSEGRSSWTTRPRVVRTGPCSSVAGWSSPRTKDRQPSPIVNGELFEIDGTLRNGLQETRRRAEEGVRATGVGIFFCKFFLSSVLLITSTRK